MTYRSNNLSVTAYANGFTLWHYATDDPAPNVIAPGYFNGAADLMRNGDMLLVNAKDGGRIVTFNLFCASSEKGIVTTAPLWTPPVTKAAEWAGHAAGFAALTAASETADNLTEAAQLIDQKDARIAELVKALKLAQTVVGDVVNGTFTTIGESGPVGVEIVSKAEVLRRIDAALSSATSSAAEG